MQGDRVQIAEYDPRWPDCFAALRDRIARALGGMVIAIEHVGSTSVPNLAAKPIIDMDVMVRAKDVPAATEVLEQHGYRHEGDLGIQGREAFRYTSEGPEHHLYVCPEGSAEFARHIALREYLRNHPDAVCEYAELKRRLAQQYSNDRAKYQEAKADFVDRLCATAKRADDRNSER
jgi:GrpB-like predicted nucleotidyltransferase (UPF0157 family)